LSKLRERLLGEPPLIPLAGRAGACLRLREGWANALGGTVHLTLVAGEAGVGKSRLIGSFLDAVTFQRRAGVVKGANHELSPLLPYRPFREILRGALAGESGPPGERQRLFEAVGRFLEGLGHEDDPLIVFLDDLHLADRDSLDLLAFLFARLEGPIWILAACRTEEMDWEHPLNQIVRRGEKEGRATRLELDRLDTPALAEIAGSLVGEAQATELAGFLEEKSGGLPLGVTELVGYLWDLGVLAARGEGCWALDRPLGEVEVPVDLNELIRLRIRRLPNSTRRLATMAAMIGQSFDVELLREAEDEHPRVVEIGLGLMLERRLIRPFPPGWNGEARHGGFEFAHPRLREAIYQESNPLRRQAMHGQVAEALEGLRGGGDCRDRGDDCGTCEALAYHFAAAGQWERAMPFLERSIERALAVRAVDAARRYRDQAIEGLGRLATGARSEAQAERWRDERERFRGLRDGAPA
jgi:predicted ATPase